MQSKLISLEEAVAFVTPGSSLGLGGWIFNSQPMALVRALVRRGTGDLMLVPAPGSIAPDLLIGAGAVRSTFCVFISFEQHGLAPQFRKAAEAGELEVIDIDGPGFAGGLRASMGDLPWMPIPDLGTDLPRHAPQQYRLLPTGPGERRLLATMAIRPDVCFLHAQQSDELGNVQFLGSPFFDVMLAQASRRVVVTVDRIVSTETVRRANHLTKLPSVLVDAVVHVPFGAHPTASHGLYQADEAHLREYVKASTSAQDFERYLQCHVHAGGHDDYLARLNGATLATLLQSE
ncbi:CoA transferase subunit A [Variovorax sp. PBL-E5]|uniref:CoA transferase subunit A n=1 Tax=Variovorax sp. PBL-E5 TaxID=434014 RepID=UPI0013196740|nr:CoA transferase subunit A [Variovorax sp. PBL-E5]VTU30738.1 Glutaconate CoA-transferase subunit A [Variovorax sp. PBL-E5]